ncbi:MAG: hypothetical protein PHO41_10860 [Eubacteriales bacterium]|nr:hypothetical protein [Eubacteriales bacterium]
MGDNTQSHRTIFENSVFETILESQAKQISTLAMRLAQDSCNSERLFDLLAPLDEDGFIQERAVAKYLGQKSLALYYSDDFVERSTGIRGYDDILSREAAAFCKPVPGTDSIGGEPRYELDETDPRYLKYKAEYKTFCAQALAQNAAHSYIGANADRSGYDELCEIYDALRGMEKEHARPSRHKAQER